jgi:hypothetical protein
MRFVFSVRSAAPSGQQIGLYRLGPPVISDFLLRKFEVVGLTRQPWMLIAVIAAGVALYLAREKGQAN